MRSRAAQQFEADGQESSPAAVSEEAEVAYANEATRQQMEQETAKELVCVQAHQLLPVAVSGVAPTEVDVVIVIEIALMLLQLIAVRSSEGSESSSGQLIHPPRPKGCTAEGMPGVKRRPLPGMASRFLGTAD